MSHVIDMSAASHKGTGEFQMAFREARLTDSFFSNAEKYSVILPTYNERKNLPIIVWLLAKTFEEK